MIGRTHQHGTGAPRLWTVEEPGAGAGARKAPTIRAAREPLDLSSVPPSRRRRPLAFSSLSLSSNPTMVLASGTSRPLLGRFPGTARPHLSVSSSSIRFAAAAGSRGSKAVSLRPFAPPAAAAATSGSVAPAISLTEKALKHLNRMRAERNEDLCLRIGVKQGGCSGMSYTMEFENRASTNPDDSVIEYDGFAIVCDPKSLLFMFGMELDYSDALIGGGFNFQNPNATKTCGCGKSFATGKETQATATACNN